MLREDTRVELYPSNPEPSLVMLPEENNRFRVYSGISVLMAGLHVEGLLRVLRRPRILQLAQIETSQTSRKKETLTDIFPSMTYHPP